MAIFPVRFTGFLARNTHRLLQLAVVVAVLVGLVTPSSAQAGGDIPLTNADVVKMVKAGVPESVILRKVQMSASNFATSPNALIELKREHVPDDVMAVMLDSEAAMRMPPSEPMAAPQGMWQSGNSHPHMPTFDAAVRVGSKTTEKISVRKNQIKVEQAGVPIFTLKWTTPPSK